MVFGLGVLWHLLRRGRRYDVVHTASFPYFSLLAAGALRQTCGYRLVVDWHEVWSRDYWLEYLGPVGGRIGIAIQWACVRIRQRAFCFSRLHAARLQAAGLRGRVSVLEGEYAAQDGAPPIDRPAPAQPLVVFAGRHIPEKRAPAVVPAVLAAAEQIPGLRGVIFGDGPERPRVLQAIREAGAEAIVEAPGFVAHERVDETLGGALCMLLPSRREGYGMIVVEAASMGVPSIIVREPDNAAIELIEDGENGTIARSSEPADLAAAIVRMNARAHDCETRRPTGTGATRDGYHSRTHSTRSSRATPLTGPASVSRHERPPRSPRAPSCRRVALRPSSTFCRGSTAMSSRHRAEHEPYPGAAAASIAARQPRLLRAARAADLLHVHGEVASLASLPLVSARRSVVIVHGLHLLRRLAPGISTRLGRAGVRAIAAAADRMICSSQAELDDLRFLPARLRAKLVLIRNSVVPAPPPPAGPGPRCGPR